MRQHHNPHHYMRASKIDSREPHHNAEDMQLKKARELAAWILSDDHCKAVIEIFRRNKNLMGREDA